MRNPLYLRLLKRDLAAWVEEGTLDPDTAEHLYETAGRLGPVRSISVILSTLGAILLGFAAMSFVAANFWGIPKAVQLTLLLGSMWLAYGMAWWLSRSGHEALGQVAGLLGVALFGVNIMLIAQIYHISAHYPDGVMMWAIGALVAAALIPSRPALAAGFVIACAWTWYEGVDFGVKLHEEFLLYWLAATVVTHFLRWRPGFHLAIVSLVYWLSLYTMPIAEASHWQPAEVAALYGVLWLAAWAVGAVLITTPYPYASALERYGVLLLFVAFFVLHVIDDANMGNLGSAWTSRMIGLSGTAIIVSVVAWARGQFAFLDVVGVAATAIAVMAYPFVAGGASAGIVWTYSGFFLLFVVWTLFYGVRHDERFIVNISFIGFGCEAVYVYLRTFDTLLNQSAFFATGGLFLILLSFALERLRRRIIDQPQEGMPA